MKFVDFSYKVLPRENRDGGLWWLIWAAIDTLAGMTQLTPRAEDARRRLAALALRERPALEVAAGPSPLARYANGVIGRHNLQIPLFPRVADANALGKKFEALEVLSKGEIPLDNPAADDSVIDWVIRAWIEYRMTGRVAPGTPYVALQHPATDLFPQVWQTKPETAKIDVSPEDLQRARALGDAEIQDLLVRFFAGHPNVPPDWKLRLDAERSKAHAGAEISDFNVAFEDPHGRFLVAIPIKSGREVGNRTAQAIKENYVHQFARPLLRLSWEAVLCYPIVIADLTLNANELVTELDFKSRRLIAIVPARGFVQILKQHSLW